MPGAYVTSDDSTEKILSALCAAHGRLANDLHNGSLLTKRARDALAETRKIVTIARLHLRQNKQGDGNEENDPTLRSGG